MVLIQFFYTLTMFFSGLSSGNLLKLALFSIINYFTYQRIEHSLRMGLTLSDYSYLLN